MTDRRPRCDNWLNVNTPAELQAFQIAAQHKRRAYEDERADYRGRNPHKTRAQIAGELTVISSSP
jgi:hypothetical protein